MIVVAISVAIAVFGTTLACMNTGVRVTYAMAQDGEVPSMLNALHHRHATPYTAVWVMTIVVRRGWRLWGVIDHRFNGGHPAVQHRDLPALWDDQPDRPGGLSAPPSRNAFTHIIVPVLGLLANIGMLLAVIYLGILGGGMTQVAAMVAIVATVIWLAVGIVYFSINSRVTGRKMVGAYLE